VSDDLVQGVDQKICERQRFTSSEISREFPRISRTFFYEIITVKLGYHKLCARWLLKMLTGAHKTQRMASAFTFLERYHKDSNEFLNHIIQVTGDETWVLFVNVEIKKQSKQVEIVQTNIFQKADDNCFLGQERSADDGIHATRDHNNV
jgi:hypothetical protein